MLFSETSRCMKPVPALSTLLALSFLSCKYALLLLGCWSLMKWTGCTCLFMHLYIINFPRLGLAESGENQTDVLRVRPWLWYSTMPDVDGNIFEIWSQLELYWWFWSMWFWTMEYSAMEMTTLSVLGMKQNRWVQSLQSGIWHMPLWCADSWAVVLPFQPKSSTYPAKHRCGVLSPLIERRCKSMVFLLGHWGELCRWQWVRAEDTKLDQ